MMTVLFTYKKVGFVNIAKKCQDCEIHAALRLILLAADNHFQPIAVEMLGPINKSASDFLTDLAHKIRQCSGDER